jgi:hypothetical protein
VGLEGIAIQQQGGEYCYRRRQAEEAPSRRRHEEDEGKVDMWKKGKKKKE